MTTSIIIVGVGGQGSVLIGKILGYLFMNKGYDIKISETHGMSQRGGSVVTNVRYGNKVYSPLIDKGEADYIIALEMLEAALSIEFLKQEGVLLVNNQKIIPNMQLTEKIEYPMNLKEKMDSVGIRMNMVNGNKKAQQAGSIMATNIVLLGCFSYYLKQFEEKEWIRAIERFVPKKYISINKKAFLLGAEYVNKFM